MDEKEIKLEARLNAIEYMPGQCFKMVYLLAGATPRLGRGILRELREHLRTTPMPTKDPAIADMAAGELQEAFERLLGIIAAAVRDRSTR